MLEINKIKNDPDGVVERLKKRGINRKLKLERYLLRRHKNTISMHSQH